MSDLDRTGDESTDTTPEATIEPTRTVKEYRGAGVMWGAIALGLVLVAFIIVVLQNDQSVAFEFLWWDTETPLSLIIAVTVAASLVFGEVVGFVWRRSRRHRLQDKEELRRLRRTRR